MIDPRQQRAEVHSVLDDPADGNTPETDAMVTPLTSDKSCSGTVPARAVKGQGNLQSGIHAFRSGIGKENVVQTIWKQVCHPVGELEGSGMAEIETRGVIQLGRLGLHRFDNLGPGMTRIDTPQTGGRIDYLPPIGASVIHTLGRDDNSRIGLECAVGGKRHPIAVEVVRGAGLYVHRLSSILPGATTSAPPPVIVVCGGSRESRPSGKFRTLCRDESVRPRRGRDAAGGEVEVFLNASESFLLAAGSVPL